MHQPVHLTTADQKGWRVWKRRCFWKHCALRRAHSPEDSNMEKKMNWLKNYTEIQKVAVTAWKGGWGGRRGDTNQLDGNCDAAVV